MSNLLRKWQPTVSGAQIGPTKKQRLFEATKMFLDIAKESTDVFPPLKSCLGGICALINHYEECKDVEDKLGDLVPWLTKLKGSVTTARADDNHEEAERYERLIQSLEDIEKRSLALLEKKKAARILDKRQDSEVVVKLVEELRQAILIYQLSQQRSIDNQVVQLASSFIVFLRLSEKQQGVKVKVKSILQRLGGLKVEGCAVEDQGGLKRKIILFEALEGIKDELLPISERSSAVGYEENDADVHAVCEIAENLRDTIMEYQLAQQESIYEQNFRSIDSDERTVLDSCRRALGAGYQHGNRNCCLKGTRESVLDEIESWTEDPKRLPVFWLDGLAGTGKTTIAQTIAERVFAQGRLGASFFCSRDFEDRSDLRFIFPTLAFQLACKYPDFRTHFVSFLQTDPDVVYEPLCNQMQKLIAEPLRKAGVSTVIVIDALDECKDDEPSSAILSVLGRFVGGIDNVKFFITGQPEPRIKTGIGLPLLIDSTDVFALDDVHPSLVHGDIRLFLQHELSKLAQRRQLGRWPPDQSIDILCRRAAGRFIHAVVIVKFLDSRIHLPKYGPDAILQHPERIGPEVKPWVEPWTVDSLYTSILQTAFSEERLDIDSKARSIIGAIVMAVNPLSPLAIADLIGVEFEEVTLFLKSIKSLLAVVEDSNQPVKPFHKSFPDFITDPSRCTDTRFFISPGPLHLQLAMNCLGVMIDGLEQDLLSLPKYALNSEVTDLQTRIDARISIALQYACRSWHSHFIGIGDNTAGVLFSLQTFLEKKFLAWLEVLSVLGGVRGGAHALESLMSWLQEAPRDLDLLKTIRDCFHFITRFFEPISASATHIYHSALELCPTSSIVRELYYDRSSRIRCLPRVVAGTPESWAPTISISSKGDYRFCTWSPCGRFVAALMGNTVEIRNQLTFELLTILRSTETAPRLAGPLVYSPDGRFLACSSNTAIVIWDIETGGVANEIACGSDAISLVWSSDGSKIGTLENLFPDTQDTRVHVNMYDVASGIRLFIELVHPNHTPYLWASNKSFRVMTTNLYPVDHAKIEIQFKSLEIRSCLTEIHTFTITTEPQYVDASTEHTPGSEIVSFSPTTSRISISVADELFIFQDQKPDPLLRKKGLFLSPRFSSDGMFFMASEENNFYIWKFTFNRYAQWRKFRCQDWIDSPQLSPTITSFLTYSKNIVQVWRLHNLPSISKPLTLRHAALSRSGNWIATAHQFGTTIEISGPHSKTPAQLIDTGAQIWGLLITSNVLLAMGLDKILSWRLTEEGLVDGIFDGRMPDCGDCIWTAPVSLSGPEVKFKVEGQIGVIDYHGNVLSYHTETGEILQSAQTPLHLRSPGYDPRHGLCGRHHPYYHGLSQHIPPPNGTWYPSETALREGWVMDPEGRRRLWLPVEWRKHWDLVDWCPDIATQFSIIEGEPIIVKF